MLLETLDALKRTIIMMAIQLMFAGFALMLTPTDKAQFLGAGIAFGLAVCSVLSIFNFMASGKSLFSCIKLVGGLLVGIASIALFVFENLFLESMLLLVTIVPIGLGLIGLYGAFTTVKRSGRQGWWVFAVLSALLLIFAAVTIFNPWMDDPQNAIRVMGGTLMYSSIVSALSLIWIWPDTTTEEA